MTRNVLIISILMCLVGATVLSGCSGRSNKPVDVIDDVLAKIKEGDWDGAQERLDEMDRQQANAVHKSVAESLQKQITAGKAAAGQQ